MIKSARLHCVTGPVLLSMFLFAVMPVPLALALPTFGSDCLGCHTNPRDAMNVEDFQRLQDSGQGVLKTFTVKPGGSVPVGIDVIDGHSKYAVMFWVINASGANNPANTLTYVPDPAWKDQEGYFTTAISSSVGKWTFNLGVDASTPPDVYLIEMKTVGKNGGRWGEAERAYLEVLPNTPPVPQIAAATVVQNHMVLSVSTTDGAAYYLDFRPALNLGPWTNRLQVAGDGTVKNMTDPNPLVAKGTYRVRAE